jgi:hypothetical protein
LALEGAEAALQEMMGGNTTLATFRLKDTRKFEDSELPRDAYIEALRIGLESNDTIQEVILENMMVGEIVLGRFLSSASAPPMMKLHDMDIQPRLSSGERWVSTYATAECKLVDLEVRFYRQDTPEWLVDLLGQLESMSHLRSLRIRSTTENINVTDQLVAILRRGVLQSLGVVCGLTVEIGPICEILKINTSPEHYDVTNSISSERKQAHLAGVLEHHNTSLKQVGVNAPYIDRDCHQARRIRYLTTLNSFGRSKASDPNTSLVDFVRLLDTSRRAPLSIRYGLLRSAPGLWS